MHAEVKKLVAAVIAERSPLGGRLNPTLSSEEIAAMLSRDQQVIDRKSVEEALLEFAAVGYVWLSIGGRGKPRMEVSAVFYPYGLRLIA
jgi:hypothetical protein